MTQKTLLKKVESLKALEQQKKDIEKQMEALQADIKGELKNRGTEETIMAVDKNGKQLPPGIRQRSNGRYEGRVKHEYKSYSVYGDTITEVKKQMAEMRYKLNHGDFVASTKVTMDDWFKSWFEQYKENQVKIGEHEISQRIAICITSLPWQSERG